MTREEAIKEIEKVFEPAFANYIIMALEQESTTKNDLALIHTEGLDEEIRCTMCTNSMKSDRGCDGSCVVNKDMYKAVMDAIEKRIQPTTKNDLRVDCISRAEAIKCLECDFDITGKENMKTVVNYINSAHDKIMNLPSVTPQEPKSEWEHDHEILKAYSNGANEVLDKIRAEVAEEICLTDNPYTKETKYTIEHLKLLEILDKYEPESEEK